MLRLGLTVVLALADGARNVSHVHAVAGDEHLFGPRRRGLVVAVFDRLGPTELRAINRAEAQARQHVWRADPVARQRSEMIIDLDATLVTTEADKQDAARPGNGPAGITRCSPWTLSGARSLRC